MFDELTSEELKILEDITFKALESLKSTAKILRRCNGEEKERLKGIENRLDKTASLYTKLLMMVY